MVAVLLALQIAAAAPTPDTVYSSPALAAFVARAAENNRRPPPTLRGYHARVESELSLLLRDTLGRERVAQVEQVAMSAAWDRRGRYDLRVVGYRSQSVGVPYSALSFARSWTVPYLYGDRLTLGVEITQMSTRAGRADSAAAAGDSAGGRGRRPRRGRRTEPIRAVHPFAVDRDQFYRFSGGDTVARLRSRERTIPIVRVLVVPHFDSSARDSRIAAFEGELDLDATRHQIVRMRGQFVTGRPGQANAAHSAFARVAGLTAVAYVELVNAEVDGAYWLPAFQRSEFQAGFGPLGPTRSVFRLVSRFANIAAERVDSAAVVAGDSVLADSLAITLVGRPTSDTVVPYRRHLTFAPADSVSSYDDWLEPLGKASGAVSAADFDDLAPDVWRADGPPRIDLLPSSLDEMLRFNRVEGLFTGSAATIRFRDAAPGLSARVHAGWAWREGTMRGGLSLTRRAGAQRAGAGGTVGIRAERGLASTNDFALPLAGTGLGLAALFGADDEDYVDRRVAALGASRTFTSLKTALLAAEVAIAEDRGETARLQRGLISAGSGFRVNRGVDEGRYARGTVTLELRPDVTGVFLEPGVGATLTYELARGELDWQRIEATLAARHSLGDAMFAARAQGGLLIGSEPPPQQLFELGGESALPGYAYKEFAGDRAAIAGLLASYSFPIWRRPWRLVRSLMLPGINPGLAAGIQGGWAEASSDGGRRAIRRLDPSADQSCHPVSTSCPPPLSRPTDGIRATVDARVTLFGGLLGFGVARPVDHAGPWRFVFRVGQEF